MRERVFGKCHPVPILDLEAHITWYFRYQIREAPHMPINRSSNVSGCLGHPQRPQASGKIFSPFFKPNVPGAGPTSNPVSRTLSIDRSRSVGIKNVSQHSQTHRHYEDRVTGSWVIFSIFEVKICEK